jgi:SpoVK/Ycf46/Vps4 family AAA+-type ATPase
LKEQLRKKVDEYLSRAEELKAVIAKGKHKKAVADGDTPAGKGKEEEEDADTKKLQLALSQVILSEKPNVRWEDIAGLEAAKEALKEAVILPIKFPHLFNNKRTPWKGILLYGVTKWGRAFCNVANIFVYGRYYPSHVLLQTTFGPVAILFILTTLVLFCRRFAVILAFLCRTLCAF